MLINKKWIKYNYNLHRGIENGRTWGTLLNRREEGEYVIFAVGEYAIFAVDKFSLLEQPGKWTVSSKYIIRIKAVLHNNIIDDDAWCVT